MAPLAPVGRLVELRQGAARAVVTTSGGSLRVYEVGGVDVVEPFDGPATPPVGCAGELLAPWPNRVVDARFRFGGAEHRLAVTEPERGHALHGLVRHLAWDVVEERPDRVRLEALLLQQPGWPYPLHVAATYALVGEALVARLEAENVGAAPCPCGLGVHPYLALRGGAVDDATLELPAATALATDGRLAPTGPVAVAGTPLALAADAAIGPRAIDTAYTDVSRRADGCVEARLRAPDGRTTSLWGGPTATWWQVFTGDALPAPWSRRALAVEPMTCGPDALNGVANIATLAPGEGLALDWGLALQGSTG